MTIYIIIFILLALMAIVSAVGMITRTNPVISALYLIMNFFSFAGLYLLLNAQFIAIIQILVYAGAIMVLFIFVIMLLNLEDEKKLAEKINYKKIIPFMIAMVLFIQISYVISIAGKSYINFVQSPDSIKAGKIESIGKSLFTTYLVPFELTSFLLLVAIIGSLVLAMRRFE